MDLEPAERNPAELRRTAFILVAIMIIGAGFVLYAYRKHEQSQDPKRPPIVAKISKNLAAKNQHNQLVSLSELEGKVWFAAPICVSQLDENQHALAMMKELWQHYSDNDQVRFVFLSIEGADQGVEAEELMAAMKSLGIDDDRCWFLTTGDTGKQRGYIKDQLRLGLVIERKEGEAGGKWKFPSEIALIDRKMHLRQRYDFKEIYQAQEMAKQKVAADPSLKDNEEARFYVNAVENQKAKLLKHTDYVLSETRTGHVD
ncbi:hypothetical protein HW115_06925 [Verrucomicrobiaceae bacterium N1E253]|uniref:Uncharacterized protein n=1 Tax=Oceaniferula marina TaxID=2748318 RepID=A0A851GJR3_9BACT|nr:hypothetical protein [Oceaniferula marina]NWK55337.1 hypothetical protein [Oceaniferula marina]